MGLSLKKRGFITLPFLASSGTHTKANSLREKTNANSSGHASDIFAIQSNIEDVESKNMNSGV